MYELGTNDINTFAHTHVGHARKDVEFDQIRLEFKRTPERKHAVTIARRGRREGKKKRGTSSAEVATWKEKNKKRKRKKKEEIPTAQVQSVIGTRSLCLRHAYVVSPKPNHLRFHFLEAKKNDTRFSRTQKSIFIYSPYFLVHNFFYFIHYGIHITEDVTYWCSNISYSTLIF